jgi:apolipoprotein N-acyltransferase
VKPRFRAWRILLSPGAGLALALSFPEYNVPAIGWISLAGLLFAVLDAGIGEAALCGFVYGVAFYSLNIPWVGTVLWKYAPMPFWQAFGILTLLIIALSLFIASFSALVAWIAKRSTALALFAAPFIWVVLELWRTRLPQIAFPWDMLGFVASHSLAVAQLASLTGIYGLSALVVAYDALLVGALRETRARGPWNGATAAWSVCTLVLFAAALFGARLVPQAQPTSVAHLVQTNLPQYSEFPSNWNQIHAADMAQIDSISIGAGQKQPGLVVWPEVPAPFSLEDAPFAQHAEAIARLSGSDFLLGVIDWKPTGTGKNSLAPYNSAALLDPQGREEFLYDKIHLVPFSEFIPGQDYIWLARYLSGIVGNFHPGSRHVVGRLPGGTFGVFICYEAIFPDHVRQFVRNGATLLINVSNDGWFGRSAAGAQHLAQARVRAVENRRWILRDTNNGFTVSIDPYGRVVASMPTDVRGELDAPYAFRSDLTLYTRWGDWIAWLSILMTALCVAAAPFARSQQPEPAKTFAAQIKSQRQKPPVRRKMRERQKVKG